MLTLSSQRQQEGGWKPNKEARNWTSVLVLLLLLLLLPLLQCRMQRRAAQRATNDDKEMDGAISTHHSSRKQGVRPSPEKRYGCVLPSGRMCVG